MDRGVFGFVRLVWYPRKRVPSGVVSYCPQSKRPRKGVEMPNCPRVNLLVVEREDGPVYYAKWRHDGRQVKRAQD